MAGAAADQLGAIANIAIGLAGAAAGHVLGTAHAIGLA
jgi:uncharacterized membrane protein YeaQ/YmgE (transglycosylase-associated protein family)